MKPFSLLLFTLLCAPSVQASESRVETYKTAGEVKLDLFFQLPDGWKADEKRPAIIFFFGGGWSGRSLTQFDTQRRYLASRGMVAIAANYRVASTDKVKPVSCVADAKSAVRWLRANSGRLGVDPNRIAAAGGSAGGHLAAAVALLPSLDDPADDLQVNCLPNALLLFNPVLIIAPVPGFDLTGFAARASAEQMGCELKDISPYHHIHPGCPPTIIFHGQADTIVPYSTIELFRDRMVKEGNRCEVNGYEKQGHGFFNFKEGDNTVPRKVLTKVDEFLVSLGWLSGDPTIDAFFNQSADTKQ